MFLTLPTLWGLVTSRFRVVDKLFSLSDVRMLVFLWNRLCTGDDDAASLGSWFEQSLSVDRSWLDSLLSEARFAASNDRFLVVNGEVACGAKFFRDGSGVARFSHFMKSPFLSLAPVPETGMFVLALFPWLLSPSRSRIEGRVLGELSFLVDVLGVGVDSVLDNGTLFSTAGEFCVVRSSAVVEDVDTGTAGSSSTDVSLDDRVSSDASFFEGTDFSFMIVGFFMVVGGAEGLSLTAGGGNLR